MGSRNKGSVCSHLTWRSGGGRWFDSKQCRPEHSKKDNKLYGHLRGRSQPRNQKHNPLHRADPTSVLVESWFSGGAMLEAPRLATRRVQETNQLERTGPGSIRRALMVGATRGAYRSPVCLRVDFRRGSETVVVTVTILLYSVED